MTSLRTMFAIAVWAALAGAQDIPREPLCRAALEGNASQVGGLLRQGADPNLRDGIGRTPLMWASSVIARYLLPPGQRPGDYAGVVRLLLEKGADVNAHDPAGRTALLLAMEGSASEYKVIGADEDMVRLLLSHGAAVNAHDDEGWSPLLKAVNLWADQPKLLALLIARGADVKARLKDGRNAVMLAARLGKSDRLALLLGAGSNVNAADEKGTTALMVAASVSWEEASLEMMKFLLAKGADPNRRDRQGRTAADRSAEAGYLARAEFLLKKGTRVADERAFLGKARNEALRREIAEGSVETAGVLLDRGADPNLHDAAGRTLLAIAASNDYSAEKTILLLRHGAAVNATGSGGETALMAAADHYQADTVKVLLEHGADPSVSDADGNSVLLRAAASKRNWMEERQPLIALLLEKGAEVNHRNAHGVTALMRMAGEGSPALPLLLEKKADVAARDDEGNTALLYAARFFARGGQRRDGWALLENGAEVNAANLRGETALILAATQYEAEAAELLLAKGAKVNAQTAAGRTALMQAIDGPKEFDNQKHGVYSPKIAKLLIEAGADVNARDREGATALSLALRRGYDDMAAALKKAGAKE